MRKIHYKFLISVCLVLVPVVTMMHSATASDSLWEALEQGGKVVIMRHAPVERGAESGDPLLRDPSCKSERNLSAEGKRHAGLVGNKFKEHNIPVSRVMHSPFCRTTATAQIAFGEAHPAQYLSLLEILDPEEERRQTEAFSQVIDSHRGDGNLVLITHDPNIRSVSFELLKHLDFLVVDPMGEEEFEELGVIRFSDLD